MMLDIIGHIANALLVAIVMGFLSKGTGKKVTSNPEGDYQLRMHKLYLYSGIFSVGIAFVFSLAPFFESVDFAFLILILTVVLLMGGLGVIYLLYYRNHTLHFNASFIEATDLWAKPSLMAWKDVQRISFNSFSGLVTLKDKQCKTLKVHQHLVGLNTFLQTLEAHGTAMGKDYQIPVALKN